MPTDFLEKTLEDIIFNNKRVIHQRGLPVFKEQAFRQVVLPSGRKIDILGFEINDGILNFDIYELKKDHINLDAISQAYNYFEEIKCLINGHFRDYQARIIMVGKRYDGIPLLNSLNIPVRVFTYDYQMDGISFKEESHRNSYYNSDENFSLGVLAWGLEMLSFTNGHPPTISFHSSIQRHLNGSNFEIKLREYKEGGLRAQKLLNAPMVIEPTPAVKVTTVVFPEPLAWTPEFAREIPYYNLMDDMEIDDSDYEPENIEADYSDYEPEPDLEEDQYNNFLEPIDWYEYRLLPLMLPKNYYVHPTN